MKINNYFIGDFTNGTDTKHTQGEKKAWWLSATGDKK